MSKSQEDFAKAFSTPIAKVDWGCPQWALWQASENAFKLRVIALVEFERGYIINNSIIKRIEDM